MQKAPLRPFFAVPITWALIVAVLTPAAAFAQDRDPLGWENVMRLRIGDSILVALDSEKYSGTVDEVGPDSLSISTKAHGPLVFPKPTVKSIRNTGRLSKPGYAIVSGALVGVPALMLMNSVRDASALSAGRLPENHGTRWEVAGYGVMGVGAWMLVAGGGKTIYKRLTK